MLVPLFKGVFLCGMKKNLLREFNTDRYNHALMVWIKNDKCIKQRDAKESEEQLNRYYTYNLNSVEDFAIWHDKIKLLEFIGTDKWYSAFELICEIKCEGSDKVAMSYIELLLLKKDIPYIRVGGEYHKVLEDNELIRFNKAEIRQDYGKEVFDFIRSYDKFGVFPDNINYLPSVKGMLNTYHSPSNVSYSGDDFIGAYDPRIKWSMIMMSHIFGDMINLGLEYMQQIWCNPRQMLPILVLGSTERQTGKTTYSNWVNSILGGNHVSLGVEDMKNDFNHFFAEKLVIAIEETQDESHSLVNKIKRISTSEKMLVNPKGVKQYTVDFYGKLMVLTNSPDNFLKVDSDEIRFWVLNIPTLSGKANHNIDQDLKDEIPYFLRLLEELPMGEKRSRMWFDEDEIKTEGLAVVQKESQNSTKKDLLYLFENDFSEKFRDEVYFNASDLKERYFKGNNMVTRNYLHKILIEFSKEGILKYSDRKISYISSLGDVSNRIGKCFWLELDKGISDALESDDYNNGVPF